MKALLIVMLVVTFGVAREKHFIVKRSHYSIAETMKRFKAQLKENGFTIFTIIDHQKNARKAGLKMHDQQVIIFGNPKGGTKLMNSNPKIGIELPLKAAVYKDRGKVNLIYKNPSYYERTFGLKKHPVLRKLKIVLDKMSNEAIN